MEKIKYILNTILNFVKKFKFIIILTIAILIVLIAIIFIISRIFKTNDYPLVFVENDQLVMWNSKTKEKKVIVDDYLTEKNGNLSFVYANNTTNLFAFVYETNLFLYNVEDEIQEKIASNVPSSYADIYFTDDDGYLIYSDENDSIYSYNIKSKIKNKINSLNEEEDYSYISAVVDNKVIFTVTNSESERTLYVATVGKEIKKEKIASNMDDFVINEEKTKIFYSSEIDDNNSSAYIYEVKSNKNNKIISSFYSLISYDDDFDNMIFTKKTTDELNFFIDDQLNNDPITQVEITRVCSFSDYYDNLCSRDDWLYDREFTYKEETSKKPVNDAIREYVKDLELLDVYKYSKGEEEKIVSNVLDVYGNNIDSFGVSYKSLKDDFNVKISELNSVSDLENKISENTEIKYYTNGNTNTVDIGENNITSFVLSKDYGYVTNDKDELYLINIKENKTNLELLDTGVSPGMVINNAYFYTFKSDEEFYTLKSAIGLNVKEVASDVYNIENKEDILYIYNDCDLNNKSCSYSKYDGNLKQILTDVNYVKEISKNKYYILRNFSKNKNTYDIYRFEDGELTQIAFDVDEDFISIYYMK